MNEKDGKLMSINIETIIEETKDDRLKTELQSIDVDELHSSNGFEPGSIGCAYRSGTFIVDFDELEIYRNDLPNYYNFLHEWFRS